MNKRKLEDWIIRLRTRLKERKYPFAEFRSIDEDLLDILEAVLEEELKT